MEPKVIVVTNRKGGVGKTTVATHLGAALALGGQRVGMVDTDPQGHCSAYFSMNKEAGLYNVYSADASILNVVREVPIERFAPPDTSPAPLYLLPGNKQTSAIPVTDGYDAFRFREIVEEMADVYQLEWIVVDTGPTANIFDSAVFFAATHFLYVTESARLSFDGVQSSMAELESINARHSRFRTWEAKIAGIIPNKSRLNTNIQRTRTGDLVNHYHNLVWDPIPLATVWQEACEYGMSIFAFAPDSKEARIAWRMTHRLVETCHANS